MSAYTNQATLHVLKLEREIERIKAEIIELKAMIKALGPPFPRSDSEPGVA